MIWTVRAILAALVAVSLVTRYASIGADQQPAATTVGTASIEAFVAAHGWVVRPNPVQPPKSLSVIVYFDRPGCAAPTLAIPFSISHEASTLINRAVGPGYNVSYRYLDRIFDRQTRVGMHATRVRHMLLRIVGWTPYRPTGMAVALATPADCAAPDVDWKGLWLATPAGLRAGMTAASRRDALG